MDDLSKLSVEQRSLIEKASKDGVITSEERAEMERAGIAKEIIDKLAGEPGKIGDGSGEESDFSTYWEEGKREAEENKKRLRLQVKEDWYNGNYGSAIINSFKGVMAPNNTHVQQAGVGGKALFAALGAVFFLISSCVDKDDSTPNVYIKNINYEIPVNIPTMDNGQATDKLIELIQALLDENKSLKEVIEELKNSQEEFSQQLLDTLQQLLNRLDELGQGIDYIAKILLEQGVSLKDIIALLEDNGKTQEEILNTLTNGNAAILESLQNILNAVNAGTELSAENNKLLAQLLEMVGNINTETDPAITNLLEKIFTMLEMAINQQNNSDSELQDSLQTLISSVNAILESLQKILDKVNAGTELSAENNKLLAQLLEMVGNINTETDPAITNLLEKIFTMLEMAINQQNNSDSKLQDLLQTLIDKVDAFMQCSQTADEKTLKLLETLIDSVNAGNAQNAQFYETILNKLDGLEAVIKDYLMNILDAVNKNGEISEDIRNLTQKVLEQINSHAVADNDALKAILEAINNLSVGTGGNVDLSKIEEMLAALLKQTEENGNLLTDINGKLDVINMTIKAATDEIKNLLGDKFDQNNEYFKQIIDKLEGFGSEGYDDTELLQKLDTILNILGNISDNTNKDDLLSKLDEILAAIKDHKVIVDVTGKITCDCNCGNDQNHEGIVGDLEDLLG